MAIKLKITQLKSGVGRPAHHQKVLLGLGLHGPRKVKVLLDTVEIRGMLRHVSHLVKVEVAE